MHENQKLVLVKPSGFIRAMRIDDNHHIGSNADVKNKKRLLQLFDRIDGSCTGRISWEQFMAYLAESADNNDILELDPQNGSAENNRYTAFESLIVPPFSTVKFINSLNCTVGYGGEKVKGVYFFWNTADEEATHASLHPKSQSTVCIGRKYGKVLLLTTSNELSYLIIHFSNLTIACYDLLSLEEKALVTVSHELTSMKYIHLDRSQFLAVGDVIGNVHCYDLCTGVKILSVASHSSAITKLLYASTLSNIVTCSIDGYIHMQTATEILDFISSFDEHKIPLKPIDGNFRRLLAHDGGILSMVFSEDPCVIITSGVDRTVKAWSPYSLSEVGSFLGHVKPVTSMEIILSCKHLVTMDTAGILKIWNLNTYVTMQTITISPSPKKSLKSRKMPSMTCDEKGGLYSFCKDPL